MAYIAPSGTFGVWRFLIKSGAGDAVDKGYPLLRGRVSAFMPLLLYWLLYEVDT